MVFELLGYLAAMCTTGAFIPQVYKSWKRRETKDISLGMYIIFSSGVLLWMLYGVFTNDAPIIVANAVTLVLALSVLFLKVRYG